MSRTPARSAAPSNRSGAGRTISGSDKDQPLIDDIRLLGRVLGDVIREQEGQAAYDLIEQIRQLSVAFRRHADQDADKALKKLLKGLSGQQTVSVIRAFTYFSHLANLAEDRHHIRRRAVHDRAGDLQEGSLAMTLQRLKKAGIAPSDVVRTLAAAHISPVLTAHPTEVQRKSILDAERAVAELVGARDGLQFADVVEGFQGFLLFTVSQIQLDADDVPINGQLCIGILQQCLSCLRLALLQHHFQDGFQWVGFVGFAQLGEGLLACRAVAGFDQLWCHDLHSQLPSMTVQAMSNFQRQQGLAHGDQDDAVDLRRLMRGQSQCQGFSVAIKEVGPQYSDHDYNPCIHFHGLPFHSFRGRARAHHQPRCARPDV